MITLERLVQLGWEKKSLYPAGSSYELGYEYWYEKNNRRIRVNEKSLDIKTEGSPHKIIETEQQLQDYDTSGTIQ